MKLYIKDRVNIDVLKFSFVIRVIEHWNKLPEKVISVISSLLILSKIILIYI